MPEHDGLRTQVQLHNYIALRDLPKRFAAVQFPVYCVWVAGHPYLALGMFLWLAAVEGAILWLIRTTPEITAISQRRIRALLACSTLVSMGYYAPGLVLALEPDYGLATGGLAWILAALSTNLVMYNALRTFYWTTAIPGIPVALAAVTLSFGKEVEPAAGYTWLLPVAIVCLYIVNTLQQLREYRDTHRELSTTRAELLDSLRKLEHMSLHDGLTGLKNRAAFNKELRRMLARAGARNPLGVLMVDLNGFKPINDGYGHEAGDAVLVAVAKRLEAAMRPGAAAFRLGGDEFAVLSYGDALSDLKALGDRLIEEIRKPIPFEDKKLMLGASIGVGHTTDPSMDGDALVSNADTAMYQAKAVKSQRAVLHDPSSMDTPPQREPPRRVGRRSERGGFLPLLSAPLHDRRRAPRGLSSASAVGASLAWGAAARGLLEGYGGAWPFARPDPFDAAPSVARHGRLA